MNLDTHELAWAAGFFDGEGTVSVCNRKGGRPEVRFAVPQSERAPLERFQRAIGGLGVINGPYTAKIRGKDFKPRFILAVSALTSTQAAMAMLWRWLGDTKRAQFRDAMAEVVPYQRRRFDRGSKGVARLTKAQADALRAEHAALRQGRKRAPRGSRAALAAKYGLKIETMASICGGHGYE